MFCQARIQERHIDAGDELAALRAADPAHGAGALVTFEGAVRASGGVEKLFLEHYPGMTEQAVGRLADTAMSRWELSGVLLVHRVGWIEPGETIVLAGVLAAHRQHAFEACSYLVDALKTDIPLWKKEVLRGGREVWVESRDSDYRARDAWRRHAGARPAR